MELYKESIGALPYTVLGSCLNQWESFKDFISSLFGPYEKARAVSSLVVGEERFLLVFRYVLPLVEAWLGLRPGSPLRPLM